MNRYRKNEIRKIFYKFADVKFNKNSISIANCVYYDAEYLANNVKDYLVNKCKLCASIHPEGNGMIIIYESI
jgi:hypothetical protein